MKTAAPPPYLSQDASAWWRSVCEIFQLEEHHILLLRFACEAYDRAQQAREILACEGVTYTTSRGEPRAHPAVAIERDARIAFARLVRELDLDADVPGALSEPYSRPPPLRSNRNRTEV